MDISGVVASVSASNQARIAESVQYAVLRKALDIQAAASLQLIQAAVQATGNPPNLGSQVDTFA
jgi:hypothetical protein